MTRLPCDVFVAAVFLILAFNIYIFFIRFSIENKLQEAIRELIFSLYFEVKILSLLDVKILVLEFVMQVVVFHLLQAVVLSMVNEVQFF